MAKKKPAKPQRAVATTSVASKRQLEEAKAVAVEGNADPAEPADNQSTRLTPDEVHKEAQKDLSAPTNHDWEDPELAERQVLQSLVDRLHDKGEREVNRIVKAIEYDRRLSGTLPSLAVPDRLREEILQNLLQEQSVDQSGHRSSSAPPAGIDEDKGLLRVFISYNVLSRLGFAEARIDQCLTEGLQAEGSWEDALEWMWLHVSEDECLSRGIHTQSSAGPDEPNDAPLTPPKEIEARVTPISEPESTQRLAEQEPSAAREPLFRQMGHDSDSASASDDGVDLDRLNERWAKLTLEAELLRASGQPEKKRPNKKQSLPKQASDTAATRALKASIAEVEKEYLFDRKQADLILRSMRARHKAHALEAKLSAPTSRDTQEPSDDTMSQDSSLVPGSLPTADPVDILAQDGEGGLFGGMLDEPAENAPSVDPEPGTVTQVRAMPIPKSFAFSGNVPKALLRNGLNKTGPVSISYVKLSGHSRAVRFGLEIGWSSDKRRVWRMDDIACPDVAEAENYVSALALHDLSTRKTIASVNWRTMPPDYRDLWEELESRREAKEQEARRALWSKVRRIAKSDQPPTGSVALGRSFDVPMSTETAHTSEPVPESSLPTLEHLQSSYRERQTSPAYQKMLAGRQNLPIAGFRQQIIDTLSTSQVVVLSGETGCGKSTQLPAYILEDQLSQGRPCKIYVTEPRRISAISLAQRVSQELGEPKGSVGSSSSWVGYSIRLEAQMSASTRLAFVTNGIALRMLEGSSGGPGRKSAFDEVTHIVVDEVHERSIESDFLLIVLKQLVQQRPDLKVVLMSATLDAEKISAFFGGCPTLSVPGRTFPVQVNYLEDAVELAGYHIDESSPFAVRNRFAKAGAKQLEWNEEGARSDGSDSDDETADPTKLSSTRYSADTVKTVNLLDSRQIPYPLIVKLLEAICIERADLQAFSAAILIFMPGLAEIRKLNELLQAHGFFGSADFVIFPLHSSISSEGQGAVFELPPAGVRKIVISTNIAETGVTIPDVTCVIDCGKHREMRYDEKRQISRLVETYIARDNAKQRRGRAGRVQEGLAFHLFTRARHDTQMASHAIPEMLRLSLQDLALRIKVLKVKLGNSIEEVLSKALDPPSAINVQRAVASLVEVKALTANEDITTMGRLLSKLPMDVHLGKFLLIATLFKCLDPALTVAATLNSKSPFVTPFGFEAQADSAKRGFAIGNSDFLTLANVFASWRRASDNPNYIRTFCKKNYLSHQNLQQIEELRQQLLAYLVDCALVQPTPTLRQELNQARYARGNRTRFVTVPSNYNFNADNPHILGAALAAGLYPKLLNLNVNGLQTISNQQPVSMHPSSINFKVSKADFGTNYLIYFTIMQSKKLYAWETGPVDDRAIVLLCGDNPDFKISASALHLDRGVRYHIHPKTAIALKTLRRRLSAVMATAMKGRELDEPALKWLSLAMRCIGLLPDDEGVSIGLS